MCLCHDLEHIAKYQEVCFLLYKQKQSHMYQGSPCSRIVIHSNIKSVVWERDLQSCIMWRVWWTGLSLTTRNWIYTNNRDIASRKNKWIESAHAVLFLSFFSVLTFSTFYCTVYFFHPYWLTYCQCFKTNIVNIKQELINNQGN